MSNLSVEEIDTRLTTLFQADELAAHEYRKITKRVTPLEPEKRLMLAVLEDAIFCFQRYAHCANGTKEKKLYQDAASWMFNRSDSWLFSFENICDIWGLDPDYLRMGLLKWQEQTKSVKASQNKVPQPTRNAMRQWGMRGHKR